MILFVSSTFSSKRFANLPQIIFRRTFSTSQLRRNPHLPPTPGTPSGTTSNGAPIKSLLNSIEKILQFAPVTKAESFIHRRLSDERFAVPNRHVLFEKIISLLIHHRHFEEAGRIYERLSNEGYVSTLKTDAQMLTIGLVLSPDKYREIIPSLQIIFAASQEFTEGDFILLLGVFQDLDASPGLMIRVIQEFLSSRGEGFIPCQRLVNILVGMMVKEGLVQEAFEFTADYDNISDSHDATRSHPYASIISSLDTFSPLSEKSINDVLAQIRSREIESDASVFNALISIQVRKKDVDKAFQVYGALMENAKEGLISPDRYTFGNLFKMISRLSNSSPLPVLPRQLFRNMLSQVFSRQSNLQDIRRGVIDGYHLLMVHALRAFLSRHDYAGAYYITKILSKVGLPITGDIYYAAVKHVAGRVLQSIHNAQKTGGSPWIHRLLGRSRSDFRTMKEFRQHKAIMLEMLKQSRLPGVLLDVGAIPSRSHRQYVMPTLSTMKKQFAIAPRAEFDVIPLQRILRRALLAQIEQERDIMFGISQEARRATGELIAAAENEMTPEDAELGKF
ncbi:hypothetical protein K435DRAFT_397780 [Dendrothele bispora CBS 962.96]|uniref:Pentatricopeptide repeat-containing protein n=1 Tax=Dendrothele bispora (strain CBS 962.96) TaxID=1314807 RepID=A0A4S8L8L3_DENBC|nr:hypothetical protein K435DRAFT_397780 [Dendrothele bispora CBS 962.96]